MRRYMLFLFGIAAFFTSSPVARAQASTPYLGQIAIVSFSFAPKGWLMCAGQILPINQYTALFALLGTMYGGDGVNTFALPDLRGRVALGSGNGSGLTPRSVGETGGEESVTLTIAQMPAHTHPIMGDSGLGTAANPTGDVWAAQSRLTIFSSAAADTPMGPSAISTAGGGQPHDNHSPYIALNYIIALQGVFPSRN